MLTREEVAEFQETGQVTPKFRLGDEVVRAIKEKMEVHFAARPELEVCQSASKIDPLSACNIDPLSGTAEVIPVVNRGDPSGFV